MQESNGYLEIVLGPMFSGKTSRLIETYSKYKLCGISALIINSELDTRYDDYNMYVVAHSGIKADCIRTDKLLSIDCANYSAIFINECQFFTDLKEFVVQLLQMNKQVYLYGLDGDSNCNKFGQTLDLIPLCDKVEKITSMCLQCKNGAPAIFSHKITNDIDQICIGGQDKYIPVCRKCYTEKK